MIKFSIPTIVLVALSVCFATMTSAAVMQNFDQRNFLHSDLPALPKAPSPKQLAGVAPAQAVVVDPPKERVTRACDDAIKAREGKLM